VRPDPADGAGGLNSSTRLLPSSDYGAPGSTGFVAAEVAGVLAPPAFFRDLLSYLVKAVLNGPERLRFTQRAPVDGVQGADPTVQYAQAGRGTFRPSFAAGVSPGCSLVVRRASAQLSMLREPG
jgi:hypothetical protein